MKFTKTLAMLLAILLMVNLTPLHTLASEAGNPPPHAAVAAKSSGQENMNGPGKDPDLPAQEEEPSQAAYTVRFCDHSGQMIGFPQAVNEGQAAVAPEPLALEGFTFQGWSEPFDAVTRDMDIHPLYAANVYTVQFLHWDGALLGKLEAVEYGTPLGALRAPEVSREGFLFDGWALTGGETGSAAEALKPSEAAAQDLRITGDTVLIALFKPDSAYVPVEESSGEPSSESEGVEAVSPEEEPVPLEEEPASPEAEPAPPEEDPVSTEEDSASPEEDPVSPEVKPAPVEEDPASPAEEPALPEQEPRPEALVEVAPPEEGLPGVDEPELSGMLGDRLTESEFDMAVAMLASASGDDLPEIHKLTIHYIYAGGATAAYSYYALLEAGSAYSVPSPSVPGYVPDLSVVSGTLGGDATLTVTYASSKADYTVRHMLQNLEGDSYTLAADGTETKRGTVGDVTQGTARSIYTGFVATPIAQAVIAADGSTEIFVRYDRIVSAISFLSGEGATVCEPIIGRYGAAVGALPVNPTRPGYTFAGWDWNGDGAYNAASDQPPATISADNLNVKAIWTPNMAAYKVIYWVQDPNDITKYAWLATYSGASGATGSQPDAGYLSSSGTYRYDGGKMIRATNFNWTQLSNYFLPGGMDNTTKIISGDGTTVVNVKYDRKVYDLIFQTQIYRRAKGLTGSWTAVTGEYHRYNASPTPVRFEQNIGELWLLTPPTPFILYTVDGYEYAAGNPSSTFGLWDFARGAARVTTQYMLEADFIDASNGNTTTATATARWASSTPYAVRYLYDNPNGAEGTGYQVIVAQEGYASIHPSTGKGFVGVTYVKSDPATTVGGVKHYTHYYNRLSFTLSYNLNGGTSGFAFPPQTYRYGQTLAMHTQVPTREGYRFLGWYLDQFNGTPFTDATMPVASVSLFASWERLTFDVVCRNAIDGDIHMTVKGVPYGGSADAPPDPVREGMHFDGWFSLDEGVERRYVFGAPVYSDMNVYAKWSPISSTTYTVKYVEKDNPSNELAVRKVGSDFVGLTVTEQHRPIFGYVPTVASQSRVLSLDPAKNVITFEYVSTTGVSYSVHYLERETEDVLGEAVTRTPTEMIRVVTETNSVLIEGYTRVNLKDSFVFDKASGDVYELIFWYDPVLSYSTEDAAKGTVTNAREVVLAKTGVPAGSTAQAKAGYRFTHWTDESGTTVGTSAMLTPPKAGGQFVPRLYTAHFGLLHTITYRNTGADGGMPPVDANQYLLNEEATVLDNSSTDRLVKTGHTFIGWNAAPDGAGTLYAPGDKLAVWGNVTLDPAWEINRHEVHYVMKDRDGHRVSLYTAKDVAYGGAVPGYLGATPALDGYTFVGWEDAPESMPDEDVYLYARFIPNVTGIHTEGYRGVYDGAPHTVSVKGAAAAAAVSYSADGGASWKLDKPSFTDVGNYEVLIRVELEGHAPWTGSQLVVITKTQIAIVPDALDKPHNGFDPVLTYHLGPGVAGEVAAVTGVLGRAAGEDVGQYAISLGTLALRDYPEGNFKAGNYELVLTPKQFTIYGHVMYHGNGSTAGTAPVDGNKYAVGAAATVLGNPGGLMCTGAVFLGWSAAREPLVTSVAGKASVAFLSSGDLLTVHGSEMLYAVWAQDGNGPAAAPGEPGTSDGVPDYEEFTVTYDGNGSTGGAVPVDPALYPAGGEAPVLGNADGLVRAGAVFLGWSVTREPLISTAAGKASVTLLTAGDLLGIDGNVTLYAVWAQDANGPAAVPGEPGTSDGVPDYEEFTVSYDGNGSTGGAVPVDPALYPAGGKAPVLGNTGGLVRTGAAFLGWSVTWEPLITAKEQEDLVTILTAGDLLTISGNVILYTVWAQDVRGPGLTPGEPGSPDGTPDYQGFRVTYDGNGFTGGKTPVDAAFYAAGGKASVLGNTGGLVRTGAVFLGWSTIREPLITAKGQEALVTILKAGGLLGVDGNMTLYAVWAQDVNGPGLTPGTPGSSDGVPDYHEHRIVYNANGGTGTVPVDHAVYPVGYGAPVMFTPVPSLNGHSFLGWSINPAATALGYSPGSTATLAMGSEDVILYAVYSGNVGKLTVRHVDADSGAKLAGDATLSLAYGAKYRYSAPQISGFKPTISVAEGIMDRGDLVVTIKYVPRSYHLTVRYVFIGGGTAAPTYRESLNHAEAYHVPSPVVEGYSRSLESVSGIMPMRDLTITIVYFLTDDDGTGGVHADALQASLGFAGVVMNVGDCYD